MHQNLSYYLQFLIAYLLTAICVREYFPYKGPFGM